MSLDVEVGIKNARFRAGLEQMRGQAKRFGGDLKGMFIGAFSVGAILSFAEKMRDVHKEALRFGTDAETIQRVGKAAKQSDIDFETLAKSINKVTLEAGKAARGGAEQARMFQLLGIDAKKFVGMSLDEKLLALSAAFQKSRSSGMETSAMLDLLGERGGEIMPLLARGPGEISKVMKEATVQTNSTVDAMTKLSKQMDMLKGSGAKALGWVISKMETFAKAVGVTVGVAANMASGLSLDDSMQAAADGLNDADEEEAKQNKAAAKPADDFTPDQGKNSPEAIAALKKQIAEEEAKARVDALSGQAKINELASQRAALAKTMGKDEAANLEIKKQDLALEHEITDLKRSQAEKLAAAKEKQADLKEKQALEKMTPEQKVAYLQGKQKKLQDEADQIDNAPAVVEAKRKQAAQADADAKDYDLYAKQAKQRGDPNARVENENSKYASRRQSAQLNLDADRIERESTPDKAVEKRTEAMGIQSQIDALKKEGAKDGDKPTAPKGEKKPDDAGSPGRYTVTASSLQRVGGGGRAYGTASDPAMRARDKTNALLQKLVEAAGKKEAAPAGKSPEAY